ncbi:MAG: hypothetical protein WC600_17115 [Desulfobaccales bacterium]
MSRFSIDSDKEKQALRNLATMGFCTEEEARREDGDSWLQWQLTCVAQIMHIHEELLVMHWNNASDLAVFFTLQRNLADNLRGYVGEVE